MQEISRAKLSKTLLYVIYNAGRLEAHVLEAASLSQDHPCFLS